MKHKTFHPERCYDGLCEFEQQTDTQLATAILIIVVSAVFASAGWLLWRFTRIESKY